MMSFRTYRALDLLLLAVIACVCDAATVFTFNAFSQFYAISVAAVVGYLAIVRWNAYGLFVAPAGGAAALGMRLLLHKPVTTTQWLAYTLGFLGLAVCLLFFSKASKKDVLSNRYKVIGVFALGYLAVDVLRVLFQIGTANFLTAVIVYIAWDLINVLFGALVLLLASKQPNLVVDMKSYLLNLSKKPASALEGESLKESKLSQLTDSNGEVNEPALLDGGMLSAEDLHAMDAPLKKSQGAQSRFDRENEALAEYRKSKKGRN